MKIVLLAALCAALAAPAALAGSTANTLTGTVGPGFTITLKQGSKAVKTLKAKVRIDTPEELVAYRHGGILPYVLRQLAR